MDILEKVWKGGTILQEPICFSTNGEGMDIGGKLLYSPSEILEVCSFDGKIHYREGKDFLKKPYGISRTEKSQIPFLSRDVYCKPFTGKPETVWVRLPNGKQYMEVISDVYRYQTSVTYRTDEIWKGFMPESQAHRLEHTIHRLQSRGELNLVFYGDSITAGWEASGADEQAIDMVDLSEYHVSIHRPPYMPAWAQLVTDELQRHFPRCTIHKTNRAAGGSTTGWGLKNASQLVNPCEPDLVILGFGMNSMQDSPEKYQSEIVGIIEAIRAEYPFCEFLLVSPMMPNPEIAAFRNNQLFRHEKRLNFICKANEGIGIATVHSIFRQISDYGKTYLELTGNCINHPNDFSIRIYAQCILAAFGI